MVCSSDNILVIGASAGALDALAGILPSLPEHCALPVVIVVHLPEQKDSLLSRILRDKCRLPVEEAEDKMPVQPRAVYVAPPDYHLQIETNKVFSLTSEEPIHFSRPSIDVLFETAADAYGAGVLGIVLTGASCDGAAGLKGIIAAGGRGLIQDPDEAEMPLMPKAAIDACPEARVMKSADIAAYLNDLLNSLNQQAESA